MMLEVLITMLLIAGALLGTAGMQLYSMKVTQASQFRAKAVLIASDMVERIETNNYAAIAGVYAPGGSITLGVGQTAARDLNCETNACSVQDTATFDLKVFQDYLIQELPSGTGTIRFTGTACALPPTACPVGSGPWMYTIVINWTEPSFQARSMTSSSTAKVESFSYTVSRTVYNRSSVI